MWRPQLLFLKMLWETDLVVQDLSWHLPRGHCHSFLGGSLSSGVCCDCLVRAFLWSRWLLLSGIPGGDAFLSWILNLLGECSNGSESVVGIMIFSPLVNKPSLSFDTTSLSLSEKYFGNQWYYITERLTIGGFFPMDFRTQSCLSLYHHEANVLCNPKQNCTLQNPLTWMAVTLQRILLIVFPRWEAY